MEKPHSDETRLSFLSGLRSSRDPSRFEESWRLFNRRYTPRMYAWALRLGLSKTDAEDVCQNLMICLLKRMKTFEYDANRSFRGWLRTVTRHAVFDFMEHQKRIRPIGDTAVITLFDAKPFEDQIEQWFDHEILQEARRQVALELSRTPSGKRNWEIFVRLETTDCSPAALASEYRVQTQTIYVAKARVIELLKTKVKWLNREE